MIDGLQRNSNIVNYNIQMSFKREPNGKKIKVDNWSFVEESWTLQPIFLSILVTMGLTTNLQMRLPTQQTHKQLCLLARCFRLRSSHVVNYAFFLQKGLFSKSSESLHGDWIHPKASDFHSSSLNVLAWMTDRVNASYLWTTSPLNLNFACLTLLATEPKLGIRGRWN
jgi:hypothetical protein